MRVLTLADHWFARCRVLGLACPRSQSAARPCERGAGNRRGGGQLRWAMVALARAIIALELACSSSAVTLPGGSQFKSIRCGTQNDHPWALSVDKSRLLAS